MFDPKPEGQTSIVGHIATSLTGVRFASYLPKIAKLADRLTVVRSFQIKHAEHNGAPVPGPPAASGPVPDTVERSPGHVLLPRGGPAVWNWLAVTEEEPLALLKELGGPTARFRSISEEVEDMREYLASHLAEWS